VLTVVFAIMGRYEADDSVTAIAAWGAPLARFPVGCRWSLEGKNLREESIRVTRAMRGRPMTGNVEIGRKAQSYEGPRPDRAGIPAPDGQPERVLVHGESGAHEAFVATSLPGVPVNTVRLSGSADMHGRPGVGLCVPEGCVIARCWAWGSVALPTTERVSADSKLPS
jgi:hypothetical protein